jgi:hypothetical protein
MASELCQPLLLSNTKDEEEALEDADNDNEIFSLEELS